jgi:hypothetical protein
VTHLQYDGRYTVFDHVPEVREQWLRVSCFSVRIMCMHTDRSVRTTSLSWEHPNCPYTRRRFSRLPSTKYFLLLYIPCGVVETPEEHSLTSPGHCFGDPRPRGHLAPELPLCQSST